MEKNVDINWKRFASGDQSAFRQLYDQFFPGIFAYCLGKLRDVQAAEDLATEVFVKLLQYPSPSDIQNPENWLYTVAKNASLSYISKHKRRQEITLGIPMEEISRDADKNEQVIDCLLYTSPSPRDRTRSRMPSSA